MKGAITFRKPEAESNIDFDWLMEAILVQRKTYRAHGHSLADATARAFAYYADDLKRVYPQAFETGSVPIADVEGIGEMCSPPKPENELHIQGEAMSDIISPEGKKLSPIAVGDQVTLRGDPHSPVMTVLGVMQGAGLLCGWFTPAEGVNPNTQKSTFNNIQCTASCLERYVAQPIIAESGSALGE